MKHSYILLGLLLCMISCKNEKQYNPPAASIQTDTSKIEKKETPAACEHPHVLDLFVGKNKVVYEDNSSRSIEIDSNGAITGSKNYKLLQVPDPNTNIIYLIKGTHKTPADIDTFSYETTSKGIKLYLINHHKNIYKYTLIKTTQ